MSKVIRLIDRTRTAADWKCGRSRFYGYEYNGRGIRKATTSLPLFAGITVHDCLATLATFVKEGRPIDIDEIAGLAYRQMEEALMKDAILPEAVEFAKEQATLIEGLVRGYYKHVWPKLLDRYPTIVCVEQEVEYELADGFIFMAKPDLIMEDRDGGWHYLEFKTTSSKKEDWINSWDTAVQLHSSVKAVEQTLGTAPVDVTIIGLYKGYISYNKQNSPFCYAYKKTGNPPFTVDQVEYNYKAGFKRYPAWELKGGVKDWIESMPENILADQFPMTAPIFVNDDLVDAFFQQRLIREQEITSFYGNEDMDRIFPQKFDACSPAYGFGCEYKKLCFGQVNDPLTEGFTLRTPHHARELEGFEAEDGNAE